MTMLFVKHRVADYDRWRRIYDEFDLTRRSLGVRDAAVYQTAGDPLEITVTHDFGSLDEAQTFATNPDLKAAMASGGVEGAPTIWFTERV